VERNRVKRLIREAFRRHREQFPAQSDVVVIAREGSPHLPAGDVERELVDLFR
jgi:ribonuclease P protein component